MTSLALVRKLEENAALRADLEREAERARKQMGDLLVKAAKSGSLTLKEAAGHAGIDYRHAKRITSERRRG